MWSRRILGDQPRDQGMTGAEGGGVFHPQAGEIVDVEEPAIVDRGKRHAPEREAIMLPLQETMQRGEPMRRIGGISGQTAGDDGFATGNGRQPLLERRGLAPIRRMRTMLTVRQRAQRTPGVGLSGAGCGDDLAQDFRIAGRAHRQLVVEIPDREAACRGIIFQRQLAVAQCLAIGLAEDRQQDAGLAPMRQRIPGDVERARMRRFRAPFQNVEPPRIVGKANAHMVGDEIEDHAEAGRAQRIAHAQKSGFATQFRIEGVVIDDVVAMRAAAARLEERRCVDVRNAEIAQIRDDCRSVVEGEAAVELQPIGGARDRRHGLLSIAA